MMRRFILNRKEDKGGVSGTGVVAEGVMFSNGKCAISWRTKYTSVAIYDDLATLEAIHGHGGATVLEWIEDHPYRAAVPQTLTEEEAQAVRPGYCLKCKNTKFVPCEHCSASCGCVVCADTKRMPCPRCNRIDPDATLDPSKA